MSLVKRPPMKLGSLYGFAWVHTAGRHIGRPLRNRPEMYEKTYYFSIPRRGRPACRPVWFLGTMHIVGSTKPKPGAGNIQENQSVFPGRFKGSGGNRNPPGSFFFCPTFLFGEAKRKVGIFRLRKSHHAIIYQAVPSAPAPSPRRRQPGSRTQPGNLQPAAHTTRLSPAPQQC